jgi:hypothetical protein
VLTLRFGNVCVPEHPLKLCPTVIVVTFSSADTVKLIGLPCDVVPLHCPLMSRRDGDVALPQAIMSAHAATVRRRVSIMSGSVRQDTGPASCRGDEPLKNAEDS